MIFTVNSYEIQNETRVAHPNMQYNKKMNILIKNE